MTMGTDSLAIVLLDSLVMVQQNVRLHVIIIMGTAVMAIRLYIGMYVLLVSTIDANVLLRTENNFENDDAK